MKKSTPHIYAPQDAAENYQPWHYCRVTRKNTAGTSRRCKKCRERSRDRRRNKTYGDLCLIPLEIRAMIYAYLVPPELPPATAYDFSPKARHKLTNLRKARDSMQDKAWYSLNRKARHTNTLNILAVSRAIHTEFKNIPAYRCRMFNGIVSERGFSLEGSLPEIDSMTNNPNKFSGMAKSLRDPFRFLHHIKPRLLQITCPFFVRFPTKVSEIDFVSFSTGLTSHGFDHVFNVLKNSPDMEVHDLQFRLLIHHPSRKNLTRPHIDILAIHALDSGLISAFKQLFAQSEATKRNCKIHIICDSRDSGGKLWWLAGLDVLIDGILKIAQAGDLSVETYGQILQQCGLGDPDMVAKCDMQSKSHRRDDLLTKLRHKRQQLALDARSRIEKIDSGRDT